MHCRLIKKRYGLTKNFDWISVFGTGVIGCPLISGAAGCAVCGAWVLPALSGLSYSGASRAPSCFTEHPLMTLIVRLALRDWPLLLGGCRRPPD